MAKTDYTKAEDAFNEGLRKIEVGKLLNMADENAAASKGKAVEKAKPKVDAAHLQRLTKIDRELKSLQKQGKNPYVRLGIDKDQIKKFVKDPDSLTPQDWETVKTIKEQIATYKQEMGSDPSCSTDDKIVESQRKDQKTKRFNINDKWIPLR